MIAHPPLSAYRRLLELALEEDIAWGDISSDAAIPAGAQTHGAVLCKQDAVVCGLRVFAEVLAMTDASIEVTSQIADGDRVATGQTLAMLRGPAGAILAGERTALNLLQRLSGVATLTCAFVQALDGIETKVVDTRKTTPGLRVLEKYAVRCGGGANHRFNLADAVLLKDNHLAILAQQRLDLRESVALVRARVPHTMRVEVEITRLDQLEPVLAGGADVVLLDNMTPDLMRQAVEQTAGRALTECSGGVSLATVRERAQSGVDIISAGALTHSAPAIDISLELDGAS